MSEDHVIAEAGDWISCEAGHHAGQVAKQMRVEDGRISWHPVGSKLSAAPVEHVNRKLDGSVCRTCGQPFYKAGIFYDAIHVKGRGWMPCRKTPDQAYQDPALV